MRLSLSIIGVGLVALLSFPTTQRNQPPLKGIDSPTASSTGGDRRVLPKRSVQPVAHLATVVPVLLPEALRKLETLDQIDSAQSIESFEGLIGVPDSMELQEITAWFVANPTDAAAWIEALADGPLRNLVVERLLAAAAARDPNGALVVADSIRTADLRDSAISSAVKQWAVDAPLDALAAIVARDELHESPILGRAVVAAVSEHPQRVAEFLPLLDRSPMDPAFVARIAETLLAKDPSALTHLWEASERHLGWRSAIADALLLHLGRNGPQRAFAWATQLDDPTQRSEALQTMFHRSVQRDPDGAPALLSSAWLRDDDRQLLASFLE